MGILKYTKFIYEYENFIDSKTCDDICDLIERTPIPQKEWDMNRNIIRYNNGLGLTKARSFHPNLKKADDICNTIFSQIHIKYMKDCGVFKWVLKQHDITKFESDYTYRSYDKNDYYNWHVDYAGPNNNNENYISYLLYLNDDFRGGKTLFLNDKISVSPKKGSVLCFPVGLWWIHKSSKIKEGNKKIVWAGFYNKSVS